ncbi:MAG TPA: type II toxin-antitoxin system HipA family toxin YjjJ [Gammaproteobacteria bacterium]|nr:type II toxin-antitoxin system HipA family toxin YjjJ [Gammaproteobacteria bacterium]
MLKPQYFQGIDDYYLFIYLFIMARQPEDLLNLLGRTGPMTGRDLARALGISAATLSRTYARHRDRVCRMGKTRGAQYALRRSIRGLETPLPVYAIGTQGTPSNIGELHPLTNGQHWFERRRGLTGPSVFYQGLPPYCIDMAPQGFLGSGFAANHPDLGLPKRLSDWGDDDRLIATARRGEDCVGNLIIGQESMDRFLASPEPASEASYTTLAETASQGNAGSSAGGEQPKFTTCNGQHHVIVKFTSGDGSRADQRWRDLITCEAIAARHIHSALGLVSASRYLDEGNRRFLESIRFDRVGGRGRRGVLSLASIADEWLGMRDNWIEAARRLLQEQLIDAETAVRIRWLEAFGRLIANSDRHFGNLTFYADETLSPPRLELAPVYDMLPMSFAPTSTGVPPLVPYVQRPTADVLDVWASARMVAHAYWQEIEATTVIIKEFRQFAGEMEHALLITQA